VKTIVIGGAGFIGSMVCRKLIEANHEVVIIGRRPKEVLRTEMRSKYIVADPSNRSQMREILENDCNVIDLAYATVPMTSFGDPIFDLLVNVPSRVSLVEESRAVGVRRLLLVSSGGTVYGSPQYLPIDELHPTSPISPYGITKLTIEHYASMYHQTHNLSVVIVRPSNAYGAGQRSNTGQGFIATAIDRILSRRQIEIYGESGSIRDYIHVSDVAEGIVSALNWGINGEVYNIGTGIGSSNLHVTCLLRPMAEESGYSIDVRHLPSRSYDVDANVLDCRKLTSISGWRPKITLQQGLTEMWKHGLINRPKSDYC